MMDYEIDIERVNEGFTITVTPELNFEFDFDFDVEICHIDCSYFTYISPFNTEDELDMLLDDLNEKEILITEAIEDAISEIDCDMFFNDVQYFHQR